MWQSKFMSLGGRLVLINNNLSNIPLYMLSLYHGHSSVLKKMDIFKKRMLWNGGNNTRKYHLVNQNTVCFPKKQGGLGILNLRCINICLLTKWLSKLENFDGLWQTIVRKKYLKRKHLCLIEKKQGDSQFWKGILETKDLYFKYIKKVVGNGMSTSFWSDSWNGDTPFCIRYKRLFDLPLNKEIRVSSALSTNFNSLTLRRRLYGDGAR